MPVWVTTRFASKNHISFYISVTFRFAGFIQHVFLKTERQKKQILFDIKGPCQGVRKNKAYTGLHAIIKEEKPKKPNVNTQREKHESNKGQT